MDPRHLIQLAAVLDKGSITAAARHLGLTQSTLTRNMATLEMQAADTLFTRSRFGVSSTALGDALAREGRMVQQGLLRSQERIAATKLGLGRQLRIGTGPIIGYAVAPALVRRMLTKQPDLSISLTVARPGLLVDRLTAGEFDLLIAPSIYEHTHKGIRRELYMKDRLAVFCGPRHALAQQAHAGPVSSELLSASPWLNIGFSSPFEEIETDFLSRNGVTQRRIELATFGDASILLSVLMDGEHLCVLPRHTVSMLAPVFEFVELPLGLPAGRRDLYLWSHTSDAGDEAIQTLLHTAHQVVPPSYRAPDL